jgi:hypothetical protein
MWKLQFVHTNLRNLLLMALLIQLAPVNVLHSPQFNSFKLSSETVSVTITLGYLQQINYGG